jgi:hypothetical protein
MSARIRGLKHLPGWKLEDAKACLSELVRVAKEQGPSGSRSMVGTRSLSCRLRTMPEPRRFESRRACRLFCRARRFGIST